MIEIKFFGNYRTLVGKSDMRLEAKSIKNLMYLIEQATGMETKKLKHSLIFLNGQPLMKNKKLMPGDEVAFFSPVSGG